MSDRPQIHVGDGSWNDEYRTCAECGRDCVSEPFHADSGDGMRIAFVCPEHGLHSVVDPFEGKR